MAPSIVAVAALEARLLAALELEVLDQAALPAVKASTLGAGELARAANALAVASAVHPTYNRYTGRVINMSTEQNTQVSHIKMRKFSRTHNEMQEFQQVGQE